MLVDVLQELQVKRWRSGPTEGFPKRLCPGAAVEAVAWMAPLEIEELEEAVKVALDVGHHLVPGGPTGDAEAFGEQRAVHSLNEAIGTGRAHPRVAVLDALKGKQQLVGWLSGRPQNSSRCRSARPGPAPQSLVKGQRPIVEQLASGHRHLGVVDLGEGA